MLIRTPKWCFCVHCEPNRDVGLQLWHLYKFWRPFCFWILSRKKTEWSLAWGRFEISISELCKNNCMTNSTKKCLNNFENALFWKIGLDYKGSISTKFLNNQIKTKKRGQMNRRYGDDDSVKSSDVTGNRFRWELRENKLYKNPLPHTSLYYLARWQ